jgi:hypothetical protein
VAPPQPRQRPHPSSNPQRPPRPRSQVQHAAGEIKAGIRLKKQSSSCHRTWALSVPREWSHHRSSVSGSRDQLPCAETQRCAKSHRQAQLLIRCSGLPNSTNISVVAILPTSGNPPTPPRPVHTPSLPRFHSNFHIGVAPKKYLK